MRGQNHYDAVVVGAGPAGATAAFILASAGLKVLIIDRAAFPRPKLCGGLLTWKSVNLLEEIFQTGPEFLKACGIISYQSTKYVVGSRHNKTVCGRLEDPFHFVRREIYDHFWLDKAARAGAETLLAEKVISIDIDEATVTTDKAGNFSGTFLLGADGATSRVRAALAKKKLVADNGLDGLATALEVAVPRADNSGFADYPGIYFGYIPWGYAWSFPGARNQILGVAGLNPKAGRRLKKSFRDFLATQPVQSSHIPAARSRCLPYGNYLSRPGYKNILLVGDAAGLADPLLGEGIYYAHKSAQLAAVAVLQTLGSPAAALPRYQSGFDRHILPELKYAKAGRQIIFSLPTSWYFPVLAFFLRCMPKKCEQTVQGQRSFKWLRPIRPSSAPETA